MTTMKPGWRRVKFGEVVRLGKERSADPAADGLDRYVGLEHLEPGDLHIRSWGNVADGTTFTTRFRPGQVLFGKRRAYQRKVAVADFEGVCSGDIYVFESANPKHLLPELLPFICQTDAFFDYAVGTSAGSLSPRTNWTSLAEYEFALPPVGEQGRMVEVLGAARHSVEMERECLERFRELRLGIYRRATTQGVDTVLMADSSLGPIPQHWKLVELGGVAVIEDNLRKPINSTERAAVPGPFPYYGPTGVLDHINEYRVDGRYVLIGEDGDHFLKWASWSMTQLVCGRFNVNNHAHLIRGTEHCRTEWLFHFYRHRSIDEWLTKQGSGRLKLTKTALERMLIALPPIQEQEFLISMFGSIDTGVKALENRVHSATSLLSHVLATCLSPRRT